MPQERRHHGFLAASGSDGESSSAVPHFMQNRRDGLFGVEQFGQIRGGTTSPSGIFWPHFMQNRRAGLLPVPQFAQIRSSSGSGGGGGVVAPFGTTASSSLGGSVDSSLVWAVSSGWGTPRPADRNAAR